MGERRGARRLPPPVRLLGAAEGVPRCRPGHGRPGDGEAAVGGRRAGNALCARRRCGRGSAPHGRDRARPAAGFLAGERRLHAHGPAVAGRVMPAPHASVRTDHADDPLAHSLAALAGLFESAATGTSRSLAASAARVAAPAPDLINVFTEAGGLHAIWRRRSTRRRRMTDAFPELVPRPCRTGSSATAAPTWRPADLRGRAGLPAHRSDRRTGRTSGRS